MFWGGRQASDFYLDVAATPGQHRFVPVLSRAAGDWAGHTGYVQDVALAADFDLDRTVVYACGSDAMIHSAKGLLVGAGLSERCFYSDAFVCSDNAASGPSTISGG